MTKKFVSKYLEILISNQPDRKLFEDIALFLEKRYKVQFISKLNGLDEKYWDFKYKGFDFTLHLQNYLGIMLFPKNEKTSTAKENHLAKQLSENILKLRLK